MLKPRVENYSNQATLSKEARAEAQDRMQAAAAEYDMIFNPRGSGLPLPAAGAGGFSPLKPTTEDYPAMNNTAKARAAFMTWMKESNPEAYQFAMESAQSPAALADSDPATASTGFNWKRFLEAATAATTAVFQTKAQKEMLNLNIKRAKSGLPPMDTSFAAPVIRTQFDVSPEIAQSLQQSAAKATMNIGLIVGAGVLAFLLLRGK